MPPMVNPEPEYLRLYREAFERYRVAALWNCQYRDQPTPGQALAISQSLRDQGDMGAWRLGHRLAAACRAA